MSCTCSECTSNLLFFRPKPGKLGISGSSASASPFLPQSRHRAPRAADPHTFCSEWPDMCCIFPTLVLTLHCSPEPYSLWTMDSQAKTDKYRIFWAGEGSEGPGVDRWAGFYLEELHSLPAGRLLLRNCLPVRRCNWLSTVGRNGDGNWRRDTAWAGVIRILYRRLSLTPLIVIDMILIYDCAILGEKS